MISPANDAAALSEESVSSGLFWVRMQWIPTQITYRVLANRIHQLARLAQAGAGTQPEVV